MSHDAGQPQNIYDDGAFFAGYSTIERFGAGWKRAAEHADLMTLLPEPQGRHVVELGSGAGQLAHHLAATGATGVVGVDVSERMLAVARAEWAQPRVMYIQSTLEEPRIREATAGSRTPEGLAELRHVVNEICEASLKPCTPPC